jgi:O-antigen ligase
MRQLSGRALANALAAVGGVLVVGLHADAGVLENGHPLLRPIGEPNIYVFFGWFLGLGLSVPALVMTRGRSRIALLVVAVTLTSAALLFTGPS